MKRMGVWGRICTYGFNNATANVICRQQGFKGGVVFNGGVMGAEPVWSSQVITCKGNETSLENCRVTWGTPVYYCYYANYVLCYNDGKSENDLFYFRVKIADNINTYLNAFKHTGTLML